VELTPRDKAPSRAVENSPAGTAGFSKITLQVPAGTIEDGGLLMTRTEFSRPLPGLFFIVVDYPAVPADVIRKSARLFE
jgi:hypothetical protein